MPQNALVGRNQNQSLQNALTWRVALCKYNPMSCAVPDPTSDAAVARLERRLRLLERLTEIGMELAEALRERVIEGGEAASDKAPDPVDAYARLSRAIRLTISLETKTDEALRNLVAGVVYERELERAAQARDPTFLNSQNLKKRMAVESCVAQAIFAEAETPEVEASLCEALEERLRRDEAYEALLDAPLRETVEQLCRDLCLTPDWSRWTGEGWADGYVPARPPWSPFNRPSRSRILDDDGEPLAAPALARPEPPG